MNKGKFFDYCRKGIMGPVLDKTEVTGTEAVLDAMAGTPMACCAYSLATAWHETAHTMLPVKEYGGANYFFRMYDPQGQRPSLAKANGNIHPGDGARYCGRGYVQLTWRNNYRILGKRIGKDLENNPDLALEPTIAAAIMRVGMNEGIFTGKAFSHFLPNHGQADRMDFVSARRIINGSDKAGAIADYAIQFQKGLIMGEYE